MLYIYFFNRARLKNTPGLRPPEYTEITQISDLRFIFSEYEDHPKMMRGSGAGGAGRGGRGDRKSVV